MCASRCTLLSLLSLHAPRGTCVVGGAFGWAFSHRGGVAFGFAPWCVFTQLATLGMKEGSSGENVLVRQRWNS